ncbi:CbiA2 [Desulfamplus magnetovallimortis]|uniref:Cobyrinate a,c-diamide synthase n=1 Tax=Desulfamplus magnetovallimortis TaxID=1246637 RepID=A0A1W1HBI9_9BACT|nr:cobyrinate a,c-diamide synthase [Desulfamplus magnetovallimortis]SLM29748.1 CbiA2 [Desulfamplus magnetovallimortis]
MTSNSMHVSDKNIPGIVIAGLKGGTGKTVISLGITAAWRTLDINVAPFKKGPDYIDAGWLAQAAGRPCYNLDTFLCSTEQTLHTFHNHTQNSDIALIEGNRGLYDGIDTDGRTSTAEIAKLLNLPVLIVLDCTKSTRTMAALLMGCLHFDPHVNIMGVILNQVAGKRHEGKVRDNIKQFCNIPVFGSVPKLTSDDFPERHMGLVPSAEHELAIESLEAASKVASQYIDLDTLYKSCIRISEEIFPESANLAVSNVVPTCEKTQPILFNKQLDKKCQPPQSDPDFKPPKGADLNSQEKNTSPHNKTPVIGIIKDSAFQFYYPDNLEALEARGAQLEYISPLSQQTIPDVDAIYMGGGFPETHAAQLAENESFRKAMKALAIKGLPIYAECGGLIFLGKNLTLNGRTYPMTDILPLNFGLSKRPVGHGYTTVEVVNPNPFYEVGQILRGHEFRYSSVIDIDYKDSDMAFVMQRGKGIIHKKDGFFKENVFGTYTHILAASTPEWADAIVRNALKYMKNKS